MKILFIILKILVWIAAIVGIYFAAHFWIGTAEDWHIQIETEFWQFFFARLLFSISIGGVFFLISLLLNWIFRHQVIYNKKYIVIELGSLVLLSTLIVLIAILE